MRVLKWHYDNNFGEWYVNESVPYAKDGFAIIKEYGYYVLRGGENKSWGFRFKKLKSAKQVAELITNG